ncbi:DoxX family protein [Kineococcus arenarius]|uniref:DoxX family protein n=1 Tax=unclassified Kineococcus TaxID=2621656 RepID=UPI003D7E1A20
MTVADDTRPAPRSRAVRTAAQAGLALALVGAGTGHLTTLRQEFQAQVPPCVPLDPDLVVLASGVVELALGGALLLTWRQPARAVTGATTAAFFVADFPGDVSQLLTRTDAFGLDSDTARVVRLLFQPALVAWALRGTGAW